MAVKWTLFYQHVVLLFIIAESAQIADPTPRSGGYHRSKRGELLNVSESESFEVNEIDDPCSSSPCKNGGKCIPNGENATKEYQCACANGFMSKSCEDKIPPCASTACVRTGDCLSTPTGAICICDVDERTQLCMIHSDTARPSDIMRSVLLDPSRRFLVPIFVGTLCALSVVAVCLLIHCCRASVKNKRLRKQYRTRLEEGALPSDVPPDLLSVSNALCRSACCCGKKPAILDEGTDKETTKDSNYDQNQSSNSLGRHHRHHRDQHCPRAQRHHPDCYRSQIRSSSRRAACFGDSDSF